jgi:hypothetical protein
MLRAKVVRMGREVDNEQLARNDQVVRRHHVTTRRRYHVATTIENALSSQWKTS